MLSLLIPQEVDRATQALVKVGIPEKIYSRTDQLSGGQQQRVALARVLVQDPIAVLADEPIASLDPELSREIMDLLRDSDFGRDREPWWSVCTRWNLPAATAIASSVCARVRSCLMRPQSR